MHNFWVTTVFRRSSYKIQSSPPRRAGRLQECLLVVCEFPVQHQDGAEGTPGHVQPLGGEMVTDVTCKRTAV